MHKASRWRQDVSNASILSPSLTPHLRYTHLFFYRELVYRELVSAEFWLENTWVSPHQTRELVDPWVLENNQVSPYQTRELINPLLSFRESLFSLHRTKELYDLEMLVSWMLTLHPSIFKVASSGNRHIIKAVMVTRLWINIRCLRGVVMVVLWACLDELSFKQDNKAILWYPSKWFLGMLRIL